MIIYRLRACLDYHAEKCKSKREQNGKVKHPIRDLFCTHVHRLFIKNFVKYNILKWSIKSFASKDVTYVTAYFRKFDWNIFAFSQNAFLLQFFVLLCKFSLKIKLRWNDWNILSIYYFQLNVFHLINSKKNLN